MRRHGRPEAPVRAPERLVQVRLGQAELLGRGEHGRAGEQRTEVASAERPRCHDCLAWQAKQLQ